VRHPVPFEVVVEIINIPQYIGMCKMTKMLDLSIHEEEMGANECAFCVSPVLGM